MSFKKFLGIISIVIVLVFSMMLTTSYAWYSFETASTTFNGVTNNDDIKVSFQKGEYINTSTAIPVIKLHVTFLFNILGNNFVEKVDEIPKTANGKINRKVLA